MNKRLANFFDKYIVPVLSVIILGAITWIFFGRVEKLEILTTSLNNTVIELNVLVEEMDKALSSNAVTHEVIIQDVTQIKEHLSSLQAIVDMIKDR
jgi:hypothetical protein